MLSPNLHINNVIITVLHINPKIQRKKDTTVWFKGQCESQPMTTLFASNVAYCQGQLVRTRVATHHHTTRKRCDLSSQPMSSFRWGSPLSFIQTPKNMRVRVLSCKLARWSVKPCNFNHVNCIDAFFP